MFEGYDDGNGDREQDLEIFKRLAIADIEEWYAKIPDDEKDQPALISQDYELTPNQIVEEVREFSEKGRRIAEMLNKVRIELAKREVD